MRTTERDVSIAVLRVLDATPGGSGDLDYLRETLPSVVKFTEADLAFSSTRPGERLWEQRLRNIRCHHKTSTNFIRRGLLSSLNGGGYAITPAGRRFLEKLE